MKRFLFLADMILVLPVPPRVECDCYQVSLLKVLCQPDQYHEKMIQAIGYLHLGLEGNGLYLHREDFNHALSENMIWVDASDDMRKRFKEINDKYVVVRGMFDANDHGYMELFSGTIKNITRCHVWSDPKNPRRMK